MENTFHDFSFGVTDDIFETYYSAYGAEDFPGPDGDDNGSNEEEDDSKGTGSDENDPPLDEDVVHSPVSPQPGKPQQS